MHRVFINEGVNQVEGIYLPYREANAELFDKVDQMVREKKTADEILDFTDKKLLQKGMGFSKKEIKIARSIWHKLMSRRLDREAVEKSAKLVPKKEVASRVRQLNLFEVLQQYPCFIIENSAVGEICNGRSLTLTLEQIKADTRNVLVCIVKPDNLEQFLNQSAKILDFGGLNWWFFVRGCISVC